MIQTLPEVAAAVALRLRRKAAEIGTDPGDPARYAALFRDVAAYLGANPTPARAADETQHLRDLAAKLRGQGKVAEALAQFLQGLARSLDEALARTATVTHGHAYLDALHHAGWATFTFNRNEVSAFAHGEHGGYEGWLDARGYDARTAETVWFGYNTPSDHVVLGLAARKKPVRSYERGSDRLCVACAQDPKFSAEKGWGPRYEDPGETPCRLCNEPLERPYGLFLDDTRTPPKAPAEGCGGWVVLRTLDAACAFVQRHGMPGHLSLDFDLGIPGETGGVFLRWLVEGYWLPRYLRGQELRKPPVYPHTSFPEGAAEMVELARAWRAIPRHPVR